MDWDRIDAYDYDLPDELIAAVPPTVRSESRLIVVDIESERIAHRRFSELPDILDAGDLLVFNDTRVVRARVHVRKETGGAVELLAFDVLDPDGPDRWARPVEGTARLRCMTRSSKKLRPGQVLSAEDGTAFTVETYDTGIADVIVRPAGSVDEMLARVGEIPLPPYIVRRRESMGDPALRAADVERYQTVYANRPGAVAAPTAGLHFDADVLETLERAAVATTALTLHVGPGTFRPVSAERLSEHEMHSEEYEIPDGLAQTLQSVTGRVVAVGTTSVRTLEADVRTDDPFQPKTRSTDLFIKPGFEFQVVDAMITNFHLPKSTLLALVYAFGGPDLMRRVYELAVRERYRFYSYGDVMLLGRGLLTEDAR